MTIPKSRALGFCSLRFRAGLGWAWTLGLLTCQFIGFNFNFWNFFLLLGLFVVGGNGNSAMQTSELWYPNDKKDSKYTSCRMPGLPERRFHGTLNTYKYCCGGMDNSSQTNCVEFDQGSWITSNTNLVPRWFDSSWETENGIYLISGENNSKSTTLAKKDGSSSTGFPLITNAG